MSSYCRIITTICLVAFAVFAGTIGVKYYKSSTGNGKPILKVKLINHLPGPAKISQIHDILEEKYDVRISDTDYDLVIDNFYGRESIKIFTGIKIGYTAEATLPNLDDYDLVLGFDYVDDPRYIRLPYYYLSWGNKIKADNNMRLENGNCNPHKRNFACFLVSNNMKTSYYTKLPMDGITARNRMFHKLSLYKDVASGGALLNNIGKPVPRERAKVLRWLSQCKFVIAYENQTYEGYITEKPFQAYFAGAVPIYYGDRKGVQDINKKAIIYAGDFATEDDLLEYIKKVDNDDELYCNIWRENLIIDPQVNWELKSSELRSKILQILDSKLKK